MFGYSKRRSHLVAPFPLELFSSFRCRRGLMNTNSVVFHDRASMMMMMRRTEEEDCVYIITFLASLSLFKSESNYYDSIVGVGG